MAEDFWLKPGRGYALVPRPAGGILPAMTFAVTPKGSSRGGRRLGLAGAFALAWGVLAGESPVQPAGTTEAAIATSDVRVELSAGPHAPRLLRMVGADGVAWSNEADAVLPSNVEMNGTTVAVTWQLRPALVRADPHAVTLVYESMEPHLRLSWRWEARAAFGPVEHHVDIENLAGREVWLPLVDSLGVTWHPPGDPALRHCFVEKGADTPSPRGTHDEPLVDGYRWIGKSSTYAHPMDGEDREIIPAEMVFSPDGPQSGWYAGIEFSGRTRIALERQGGLLKSRLGLDPEPGPFRTRLERGSTFSTPGVFLGAFAGGPDGAGNQLRPWVRAVLNNPRTWQNPLYPLLVNNSWGRGLQVDEASVLLMMDDAKDLGLEMFHLDAGWFRGVGDWYPDSKKFPHGLATMAGEAHRRGLRFGLWVDWTQAGVDPQPGALNLRAPGVRSWLARDPGPDWQPEAFKGETIDLGVPDARDYAARELKRLIADYHLDMLEQDGYVVVQGCSRDDHPHAPPDRRTLREFHDSGFDFSLGSNSTDVSYHAVRAYYALYEQVRREHPGLLLEICNDGGRMVDFGTAAHGDYFSITDTYDPLSNRRAFFDASHVLPAAMLECYVEAGPTPRLENFLHMLRSGMMGWTTLMIDTTAWSPEQHRVARKAFVLYKQRLRPLIREARLYHVSARPDGVHWDGLEYWDPARRQGVVFAFRGTGPDESDHRFALAGLDPQRSYRLHFEDASAPDRVVPGEELMAGGLAVHLPSPLSSELVFLEDAPRPR